MYVLTMGGTITRGYGLDRMPIYLPSEAVYCISLLTCRRTTASRPLNYAELVAFSDERLIVFLVGGHHDALAVLFDRYHRLVLNVALRILGTRVKRKT